MSAVSSAQGQVGLRPDVPPVFLHIGAMKTGTTFLQNLLVDNRESLASAGYLFPGRTWKRQVRGAQDVVGVSEDPTIRSEAEGAWTSLAQEMRAYRGEASVVSMEFLSHAVPERARWAVEALAPAPVHVVVTVRDATPLISAQWQTTIRSGNAVAWPDFRRGVRRASGLRGRARLGRFADPAALKFRHVQDIGRLLSAWGALVPRERLHVVTVPADNSNPRLLWERFAGVVGLDPDLCPGLPPANESLGYASAELLRRVNAELGRVPMPDYNATVREYLAGRVLAYVAKGEQRPQLDHEAAAFALVWNQRTRRAITRSGAHLVGDLEDLPTTGTDRHQRYVDDDQSPPGESELLPPAEAAVEAMRALVERRARRAAKQGYDLSDLDLDRSPQGTAGEDVVTAAVAEVAELCRQAIELRRRYRS